MFENIDWGYVMEAGWFGVIGALIGVAGSLIGILVTNIKGYKNISGKMGKLDDITLSGQHQRIEEKFENKINEQTKEFWSKIGVLDNTTLSGQQIAILKQIRKIETGMEKEKAEKEARLSNINANVAANIAKIKSSVENLSDFAEILSKQIKENAELKNKLSQTQNEKEKLIAENKRLREIIQKQEFSGQPQKGEQNYSIPFEPLKQSFT